ncbi:unnamed protein product [Amoebophrya sp. A120]|nr:unnamed protein product [Amoebophrya sp. A120]|eukprot:GSA120T00020827001.1
MLSLYFLPPSWLAHFSRRRASGFDRSRQKLQKPPLGLDGVVSVRCTSRAVAPPPERYKFHPASAVCFVGSSDPPTRMQFFQMVSRRRCPCNIRFQVVLLQPIVLYLCATKIM